MPIEPKAASFTRGHVHESASKRSVKHVNRLVKKISADKRCDGASSIESGRNRANRGK
jgi:hypothetical protein